jgi:hypothetical protein
VLKMREGRAMGKILVLAAAVALSGCIVHRHGGHHGHHAPGGEVVVIPSGHVHDLHCGHSWHNGRWYHHKGHVHGLGCGHHHHGGRWVHVVEHRVDRGHVCADGCDHYHHSGLWYVMPGHTHGPGCGHAMRGGVWVVAD